MAWYAVSVEFNPVVVEVEADSPEEAAQLAGEKAFDVVTLAEINAVEED